MKKHMGKRILAIALAAAMMSSVVDYSCVMEVHAEESSNESVNTDEAAEVTEESNETAEITEDTGDVAETVAEEEAVTTEENETSTEEDAENGVTEPEVTVEPEKTDAASEPDDVETKPAAEPTEETTVVESQKAIPAVSSEVTLSEAMQTENSQTEASTEYTGETSDQKDAEKETEEQTLTVEETAEIDPEILEQLPDNDELFAGHVEQVLYGNDDVSTYADYGESKFTGINLSIYHQLKELVQKIANEGGTAVVTIPDDLGIRWETQAIEDALKEEAKSKFANKIQMSEIISTLLVDCPYDMYWYNKTVDGAAVWGYSITHTGANTYYLNNLTVRFTPVTAYKGKDPEDIGDKVNDNYIDPKKASAASVAAENAQAIVTENASKSDYEKLVAYRKKICELVSYNNAAAEDGYVNTYGYGDPWQLIYVFDGKPDTNVVCEGYSKAFQYLCDLSKFTSDQINCYTVTGKMSSYTGKAGDHMWNVIRMDDGRNYLVDVTNCDGNGGPVNAIGYPDRLFLAKAYSVEGDTNTIRYTSFNNSTCSVFYTYDSNTKSIYDENVLALSKDSYEIPVATKDLTESMVNLSQNSSIYNGDSVAYTYYLSVSDGIIKLSQGTDYTVSITKDGENTYPILEAGIYELCITGKGKYKGTVTKTYTVNKHPLIPYTESVISKTYDGTTIINLSDIIINVKDPYESNLAEKDLIKATADKAEYSSAGVGANIPVTVSGIQLTGEKAGNYELTETSLQTTGNITAVVANAEVKVNGTYTYTGTAIEPEKSDVIVTIGDKTLDADSYDIGTYSNNISATDKATVIVQLKGNYTGTVYGTFPILSKNISSTGIYDIYNREYTGEEIKPRPRVMDNGQKLIEGKDYSVSYENNTNVGTGKVIVTGLNNYTGSKEITFKITEKKKPLQGTVSITGKAAYGETLTADVTINNENAGEITYAWYVNYKTAGTDKTLVLNNASMIGKDFYIEVKASNCTGILFAELSVDKNGSTTVQKGTSPAENKPQNGVVNDTKGVDTFTFTGKAGVSYEYSLDGGTAWKNVKLSGTTGTVSVGDVDLATGMLKVRAKETNVYLAGDSIWNTTAFTVAKETPVTPTEPSEPTTPSQPTTPTEPSTPSQPTTPTEPSAPTTPEQPSVPEQPSTPVTPTRPEQPSEEPEVEPDTLNVTVGNIKVQSYTGKGITPKITVKDPATRKKLKQGKHYTVSYENNVNVGTAAIVIRGIEANGYSGVKHVYFTIQPQTVAKKMKASVAGKKFRYTGYELTPGVNLTYNKMKLTEGVDYVVSYSNNVEKGTAKIFITGIGNYTGSRTVKFKITGPKLKDAQVSLVQNGTLYPDITVTYAGKTLVEGQDYIVKYPKVVKPGNNRITVRGRGSFSGSVKLTYYVEGL